MWTIAFILVVAGQVLVAPPDPATGLVPPAALATTPAFAPVASPPAAPAASPPAAPPTSGDALIETLRNRWLFADRIDWSATEAALRTDWSVADGAAGRAALLVPIFARAGDVHSRVHAEGRTLAHFDPVDESQRARLLSLLDRERAEVNAPTVAIVDGDIGYLRVPTISASTPDELRHSARGLRDSIASIAPRVGAGWIVDLRLNGGGNLMPMLLGLRPLLGEGVVAGTRDRHGALAQQWVLSAAELHWRDGAGDRVFLTLADPAPPDRAPAPAAPHGAAPQGAASRPPVVVLVGPLTRSSGQALALAFVGRPGATSVGESTARGYATVTAPFEIDPSLSLTLAVGFMTDRTGRACGDRVEPEHRNAGPDDFDALERDAKVLAAIRLLRGDAPAGTPNAYDPLARSDAPIRQLDLVVEDDARRRELPLRVYLPPEPRAAAPSDAAAAPAPAPVVLFSHGLGGSCRNNPYLGEHWAARGYVAVFMQHPGSDESVWRDAAPLQRMATMRRAANGANILLRVKDVPAVIDQLERWNSQEDHALAGRMDLERIGMSGHSSGAMTTQAVSGQSQPLGPSVTDPRIDAAVMMSPSAPRRADASAVVRAFAGVRIPWLLMTGTKDEAPIGDQSVEMRLAVYPALPPGDKYEIVLWEAEHSAFGDRALPGDREGRNANHHRVILALTTAFWDAYLRRDPRAIAWLQSDGPNAGPRAVIEAKDRWQRK